METLILALLVLIASAVGTLTGFGTSTIMIPVLALFLPPLEAIFLTSIVHWFGNVWKITLFRKGFNLKLIVLFGVPGLVSSYVGASISLGAHEEILLQSLGAFLAAYAVFLLFQPAFKVNAKTGTALIGGALSGLFAGLFGVGGAIRAAFLSSFNLPKAVFIATVGAIGLLVDSTRIVTYAAGGAILPARFWWSLLLLIPISFIGAQSAKRFINRIPQNAFRIVVASGLFLIGLKLALFP